MRYSSAVTFVAFAAIGVVKAQDVEADNVPSQCQSACSSLISSTANCDNGRSDEEQLNCVCSANNASTEVPNCAACISMYGDQDNDAVDLVQKCGFSSTTYSGTSMAAGSSMPAMTTSAAPAYGAGTGSNYTQPMTSGYSNGTGATPTGGMGGAYGTGTMPSGAAGSGAAGTGSSSSSDGLSAATGAASANSLPALGAGAGALLAALGWL